MSSRSTEVAPYLTGPAYAVATVFVVSPLADVLTSVWPLVLGNPQWRYGAVGLGANYLISALFGALGLTAIAAARGHARFLKVLSVLDLVCALVLLIATFGFALDALQMRASVPKDNPRTVYMFDAGAAKAACKYLFGVVVMLWLALASRRAARSMKHAEQAPPVLVREGRA